MATGPGAVCDSCGAERVLPHRVSEGFFPGPLPAGWVRLGLYTGQELNVSTEVVELCSATCVVDFTTDLVRVGLAQAPAVDRG